MKAVVAAFNQEKALVSVITNLRMALFEALIRTEKGYCGIQWKESSTTSPDPFSLDSISVVGSNGVGPPAPAVLCDTAYIAIPNLSPDGIVGIPMPVGLYQSWQSQVCGSNFGIEGMSVASVLVSKFQTSHRHYHNIIHSVPIQVVSSHLCWESTQLHLAQQSLHLQLLGSIWIILSCLVK